MVVTCKNEKIKLISIVKNSFSENMRNWQKFILKIINIERDKRLISFKEN